MTTLQHISNKHLFSSLLLGAILALTFGKQNVEARVNDITVGISSSYDYNERQFETVYNDDGERVEQDYDDYNRLIIQPKVRITSESIKNFLEVEIKPSLKYDLDDSETNYDTNFFVAASHSTSREMTFRASNHLLRSDHYDSDSSQTSEDQSANFSTDDGTPTSSPQTTALSNNRGRQRYWKNDLNLGANYKYGREHVNNFDVLTGYSLLRNDESQFNSDEDYDRYEVKLSNTYSFDGSWKSDASFAYIRGEFEQTDDNSSDNTSTFSNPTGVTTDNISTDNSDRSLDEYRLNLSLTNTTIDRNTFSIHYDYTGARYDGGDDQDTDIHDGQFRWTNFLDRQLKSIVGFGPSYTETDSQDGEWGVNGIAQIIYSGKLSNLSLGLNKGYEIENFSGYNETGFIDYWRTYLSGTRKITPVLSTNCKLEYYYSDRQEIDEIVEIDAEETTVILGEYNEQHVSAQIGSSLQFRENITFSISYTYLHNDSDIAEDNYDDHRFLATISWQDNLFHWL